MKTLSLLILLFSTQLNAQIIDCEKSIEDINLNLDKFHKEYRTGTVFTAIGTVVMIAGVASLINDSDQEPTAIYMGALFVSVGTVIHFDSHKFFNPKRRQ